MADAASPLSLALRRFTAKTSVRVGLIVLAIITGLAIYAPLVTNEVAVLWIDEEGWRLPAIREFFNRRIYGRPHDLLFNCLALLLPFLLLGGWLLRRRLSLGTRLLIGGAIVIAAFALSWIPLVPSDTGLAPLYAFRPEPMETKRNVREGLAAPTLAIFAPVAHDVGATYEGAVLKPPATLNAGTGERFWLGTDVRGRDILAQMVFGARISLTIGFVAMGLSLLIGTIIGATSGYFGGTIDIILQRLVEIMMCFPTFILVLVVVAMTGRDIFIIMLVLGLTGWAGTARLVRGEFLSQGVRDYVLAAECLGLPRWRIMFRHILPNAITPLLIAATFGIAGMVLAESGLAFLGLGDPTAASWGELLNQGRENIRYAWLIYVPGLAVFILIMTLNLLGNALSEVLDPRRSEQ